MTTLQTFNKYRFGSHYGLTTGQMHTLIEQFHQPPTDAPDMLAGRLQAHIIDIPDLGRVVIKHYLRGGAIRHVNRQTYLGLTKPRSRAEFELLDHVRRLKIPAPEPVAFAATGNLFYRAWLVTREIPAAQSLARISRTAPGRAEAAMAPIGRQMQRLIGHGILHVDLHPGNVLVDANDSIFFIDFDKAKTGRKNQDRLRDRYLERWRRAVQKYQLPDFLNTQLEKAL